MTEKEDINTLKKFMKSYDLSFKVISKLTGSSLNSLYKWSSERSKREIPYKFMPKLRKKYKEYLLNHLKKIDEEIKNETI